MFSLHIHVLFLSRLSSYNYTELYRKLHFDTIPFRCVRISKYPSFYKTDTEISFSDIRRIHVRSGKNIRIL